MSIEEFNKKLKEKLEDKFGKEYVNNKIVIMGVDDEEDCQLEGIKKVNDKIDSMNEKLDNYLDKTSRAK
jgi:hypothetical protein